MIFSHLQVILISTFFILLNDEIFRHCQATPLVGKDVRKAENNEFPYVVSLSYNKIKKVEKNHMCGGTLITREHILTAAHCVEGQRNYASLVVKVGSTDLQDALIYEIKWWATYNEWAGLYVGIGPYAVTYNDIAIVKLRKEVNSCIQLGILTKQTDEQLYGKNAKTAGWGTKENDKEPRYLETVGLIVHYPRNCLFNKLKFDEESHRNRYSAKLLCTFADPPTTLGCGDSGSPLILNKREIIGVNLGACSEDEDPRMLKDQNIHASINFYRKFIQNVAKPGCILIAYNETRC